MICKTCGKELLDNAKFCANCGAPVVTEEELQTPEPAAENEVQEVAETVEETSEQSNAQSETETVEQASPVQQTGNIQSEAVPVPEKAGSSKLKKMLVGGGILAAVLIGLIVFFGARKPVIDLNDFISVEFVGYEGYGQAMPLLMPRQEMLQKFGKKIKFNKKLAAADKAVLGNSAADAFLDSVVNYSYSLNQYGNLSNGDTVTLGWDVDDAFVERCFNCKVKHEPKKFKVEGLQEIGSFDAFADVKVNFEGYNGYGTVTITSGKYDLGYVANKTEGLSNGGTIKISFGTEAEMADWCAREYGGIPSAYEKTYTVSGLKEVGSFDAFAGMELKYSGMSGYAKATMRASDPEHPELFFFASPLEGLANGDEVTVYVVNEEIAQEYENVGENYDDFASFLQDEGYGSSYETGLMEVCAEKYGSIPEALKKTYTVEGLDYYISKADEIPDDIREQIKQQTIDATKAIVATGRNNVLDSFSFSVPEDMTWEIGEYEYLGFYFLKTRNPGSASEEDEEELPDDNAVVAICKTSVAFKYTNPHKEAYHGAGDLYCYVLFENLYCDKDGKVHVDLGNYEIPSNKRGIPKEPDDDIFSTDAVKFAGYASMDELYDSVIAYNSKNYTYEDLTQKPTEETTEEKAEDKTEEASSEEKTDEG